VSLFFVYVASLIVLTGKIYYIQLVRPGIFSPEIYPQGYFTKIVITSTHVIALIMLLYSIRQFLTKSVTFKLCVPDILLIVFYILKILSAIVGSKDPQLSLTFELIFLGNIICYFYARIFLKFTPALWKSLTYLLSALVTFEVLLGFSQLSIKSPLFRTIEYQVDIERFGQAVDETRFTYRPGGTFEGANSLGIWLAALSVFLLIPVLKSKSNVLWISFVGGCALLTTTLSRSAWLGLCIGFLFLAVYLTKRSKPLLKTLATFILKWRFVIFPILLFLVIFFVLPRIGNSLYSFQLESGGGAFRRFQNQDAIQLILLHPLIGIGAYMGVYEGIALNLYTMKLLLPLEIHNWFLLTAVSNGLLAVIAFVFFTLTYIRRLFPMTLSSEVTASVACTILCVFTAGLFQPFINIEFILLLTSLSYGVTIMKEKL